MDPDAATFEARFEEDYVKLFGRSVAGMDIEITVWSVNATTPSEEATRISETGGTAAVSLNGTRQLFDAATGSFLDADLVDRDAIKTGQRAMGPAAITEAETTIIVPASRDAIRQPDGCIDLVMKGAAQ